MKPEIKKIRDEIEDLCDKLVVAQRELNRYVDNCQHEWGPTEADHIVHPGYMEPGDAPGTMGIDFRGPMWIPERVEKQWKRVCKQCGNTQYTKRVRTENIVKVVPEF